MSLNAAIGYGPATTLSIEGGIRPGIWIINASLQAEEWI
jgi:hypothetical protein